MTAIRSFSRPLLLNFILSNQLVTTAIMKKAIARSAPKSGKTSWHASKSKRRTGRILSPLKKSRETLLCPVWRLASRSCLAPEG
ncbi:hypothetical protein EDD85DRAFT_852959 [Armillaria nabsnona]|nr:hypothetical protein EDD85DRAFT_852959 [Armillaria nabsnona]